MTVSFKFEKESIIEQYENTRKSLEQVLDDIQIKIVKYEDKLLEFDLINVNCSVANAIRRILINEIPTMAIENVRIRNNTTVLPDEMLCNRLGLLPLRVNPDQFEFYSTEVTETNSLLFKLNVENNGNDIIDVTTDDIIWCPIGSQKSKFDEITFDKNVLILKLAPSHSVDLELYCQKNIGKIHAKWSPVCPASYRLMPLIEIGDIYDDEAMKLKSCFSKGVIELREENGRTKAYVSNARLDSMSREVLRHKEFEDRVFLGRKTDHYIFTIESVYLDPLWLLKKAIHLLIKKSEKLVCEIDGLV